MAIAIIIIFILGYLAIAFEHTIRLNKAATALVTGVLCWTVYILFAEDKEVVTGQLSHHVGELSQILFFLMGAMTIVELIDAHDGFEIVTSRIKTTSKGKLMWIIALLSFFFSAVLDNLTTTINWQALSTDGSTIIGAPLSPGSFVGSAFYGGTYGCIRANSLTYGSGGTAIIANCV